jgi:hypothetical protein
MSPLNGWQGEVGDKRNWETVLERNLYIHVFSLMLTISVVEVKGKMSKLVINICKI